MTFVYEDNQPHPGRLWLATRSCSTWHLRPTRKGATEGPLQVFVARTG
jgi:hypothetical protein